MSLMSVYQPLGKADLEDLFSGVVSTELGPSLEPGAPNAQGKKNHMDKSLLSSRALVNFMGIPDHLTCLLRNLYAGQNS